MDALTFQAGLGLVNGFSISEGRTRSHYIFNTP